jgi:hypothetical protein
MPEVSKAVLKTYFEDGKEPNENKFIDLVDTLWEQGGGLTDHGALDGLADDDHSQYLLANGSRIVSGGLAIGAAHPRSLGYGHLFVHDGSVNDYGFIEAEGNIYLSSNAYFDGSNWKAIKAGKAAVLNIALASGLLYRGDTTTRSAGEALALTNRFGIDLSGNAYLTGGLYVGNSSPVTTVGRIKATERLYLGGGAVIGYVSGSVDDDSMTFYQGAVKVGEIGSDNTTWLKLNHKTNKGVYSPRHMRIDGGLSVTSSISDAGNGVLAAIRLNIYSGSTLVGDIKATGTTWLRINESTGKKIWIPNTLYVGSTLTVGTSSYAGSAGDILYTGQLRPYRGSALTGYIFIPLIAPIEIYYAAGSSGSGSINLTPTALPNYVKAIAVRIYAIDTNSQDNGNQYFSIGGSTASPYAVIVRCQKANSSFENSGVVPATGGSNSYVYWKRQAGSTNSLLAQVSVYGYWI